MKTRAASKRDIETSHTSLGKFVECVDMEDFYLAGHGRATEPQRSPRELRLIVTKRCNFDCYFCNLEGVSHLCQEEMYAEDYAFLYKVCEHAFGMNTITITGGEPTIRKDLGEICSALAREGAQITLVTNGSMLDSLSDREIQCLFRVNISLNSADSEVYESITQNDTVRISHIIVAMKRVTALGVPVCINAVIMDDESYFKFSIAHNMMELYELANDVGADLKFIELFEITAPRAHLDDTRNLIESLESSGGFEAVRERRYAIGGRRNVDMFHTSDYENVAERPYVAFIRTTCASAVLRGRDCSIMDSVLCNRESDVFIDPSGSVQNCMCSRQDSSILHDIRERNAIAVATMIKLCIELKGQNCPLVGGMPISPSSFVKA